MKVMQGFRNIALYKGRTDEKMEENEIELPK